MYAFTVIKGNVLYNVIRVGVIDDRNYRQMKKLKINFCGIMGVLDEDFGSYTS